MFRWGWSQWRCLSIPDVCVYVLWESIGYSALPSPPRLKRRMRTQAYTRSVTAWRRASRYLRWQDWKRFDVTYRSATYERKDLENIHSMSALTALKMQHRKNFQESLFTNACQHFARRRAVSKPDRSCNAICQECIAGTVAIYCADVTSDDVNGTGVGLAYWSYSGHMYGALVVTLWTRYGAL